MTNLDVSISDPILTHHLVGIDTAEYPEILVHYLVDPGVHLMANYRNEGQLVTSESLKANLAIWSLRFLRRKVGSPKGAA